MSYCLDANYRNAYGEMTATVSGYDLRASFDGTIDRIAYHFAAGYQTTAERTATISLRTWAKHSHGNAPSGTPYGSYRITLPNGRRERVSVCF